MRDDIDGPSFLLHSARQLGSSLDPPVIAARAAALAVPVLSDRCMVDLADDRGALVRAAEAHADESRRVVLKRVAPHKTEPERLRRLSAQSAPAGTSRFVVPLTGRGRCVGAMTFAFADATRVHAPEQRVLARQLARLVAQAVANARIHRDELRRRDELLATIAHDLRAPLATMVFAVRAIEDGAPPKRLLGIMRHSGEYMSRMVEDLLEIHRIDGAGLNLALDAQRPCDLARDAIEVVWGSRSGSASPVSVEIRPDLPLVAVDRHRIVRVLSNLLDNAAKSRDDGVRIVVRGEVHGEELWLSVGDNGRGISAQDLPRVFDRFWRAAGKRALGSGLGLSIAQEIVTAHGGRLWADSTKGVGTTFFIALRPIARRDAGLARTAPEARHETAGDPCTRRSTM